MLFVCLQMLQKDTLPDKFLPFLKLVRNNLSVPTQGDRTHLICVLEPQTRILCESIQFSKSFSTLKREKTVKSFKYHAAILSKIVQRLLATFTNSKMADPLPRHTVVTQMIVFFPNWDKSRCVPSQVHAPAPVYAQPEVVLSVALVTFGAGVTVSSGPVLPIHKDCRATARLGIG